MKTGNKIVGIAIISLMCLTSCGNTKDLIRQETINQLNEYLSERESAENKKFENIEVLVNTRLNAECHQSEESATRYFNEMVLNKYNSFALLAEDVSMLHTVEEYMQINPLIKSMEIEKVTLYNNGYAIQFKNIETNRVDVRLEYAIATGDTSFLNSEDLIVYNKIYELVEELQLKEKSDIDKVVAIHDYLVLNTEYDKVAADEIVTPEEQNKHSSFFACGPLITGKAVCSGYSSAFKLLCLTQDIECENITSDEGNHGWNVVKIDDEWYHIDVTWDDPVPNIDGKVIYKHFMMTNEEVDKLEQHQNWECECDNITKHNCISDKYRLYKYNNYICETLEDIKIKTVEQKDSSEIILVYNSSLDEQTILELAIKTAGLSGEVVYYPSSNIGDKYKILIILK